MFEYIYKYQRRPIKMVKREIGERANILFDDIDLKIVKIINDYSNNGIGVIDLSKKLNITHISLKPHIDKLIHLELIFMVKNNEDRAVLKPNKNDIEKIKVFLDYLNETNNYLNKRKIDKSKKKPVGYDLRDNKVKERLFQISGANLVLKNEQQTFKKSH